MWLLLLGYGVDNPHSVLFVVLCTINGWEIDPHNPLFGGPIPNLLGKYEQILIIDCVKGAWHVFFMFLAVNINDKALKVWNLESTSNFDLKQKMESLA